MGRGGWACPERYRSRARARVVLDRNRSASRGAGEFAPCYRSTRRVCVAVVPRRVASEPSRSAFASGTQLLYGCLAFRREAWHTGSRSTRGGLQRGRVLQGMEWDGVFGLSSSCRRRLACRHVAGCVRSSPQRDASPQWRVQPNHKPTAPVSLKARVRHAFLSTRQSQRMTQLMSQHAMHAELERVRKEKSYSSAFLASHESILCKIDRTSAAISFSFKAVSHLPSSAFSYHRI